MNVVGDNNGTEGEASSEVHTKDHARKKSGSRSPSVAEDVWDIHVVRQISFHLPSKLTQ